MSLQQQAYRATGWSGLGGIFSNSMELLKYVILARVLDPSDFGLLAMAMVIISLGRIFADGGTSNAVIHFREQTGRQLSTLYWINTGASVALFGLIYGVAPSLAAFFDEPEVVGILQLGALVLPLYAIGALYEVLLRKKLAFKYITLSEVTGSFVGLAVAVPLACLGFGVYSLIWAHIAATATLSLLYVLNGIRSWRPALCFHPVTVWPHIRFGAFQMGDRGLGVYATRIDQLIIGRFFGAEILGAYHLAYHLVLFPVSRLSPLLNRVAFPVFSSRQNDNAVLRNGYLKLMQAIISLIGPLFLLAAVSAPWLVPLLFGEGWQLAASLIPLMSAVGLLRMMGNPSGNIVLAKGRVRLLFLWNLATAVLSTFVFLTGAQFHVHILLWMYLGANVLYFGVGQKLMVNNLIGLTWGRFLGGVSVAAGSLALAWAVSLAGRNLGQAIIGDPGNFTMVAGIALLFLMVYLPLLWWTQSYLMREFLNALNGGSAAEKTGKAEE